MNKKLSEIMSDWLQGSAVVQISRYQLQKAIEIAKEMEKDNEKNIDIATSK